MVKDRATSPQPLVTLVELLTYTAIYLVLGLVSLETAYIQTNTATAWIPSGYGIALLVVRGPRLWPAVMLGSLLLNLSINLRLPGDISLATKSWVACAIATGNAGEAILGSFLMRRYTAGANFFKRSRNVLRFALVVVLIAPSPSLLSGVSALYTGGFVERSVLPEICLTWYIANSIGILIFTGPFTLLFGGKFRLRVSSRIVEASILALCLVFVGQAICGIFFSEWFRDWPRTYMVIPLLLWASFRFNTSGAMLSVVLVTLVAAAGTTRGFSAFPAETPSHSLIVLQIFLGLLAVTSLSISASLSEVLDLRSNLERKVRSRTMRIERLMREREVFTGLVAHDLQSPLYSIRNALRAAAEASSEEQMSAAELTSLLTVSADTCTTLAGRITQLLTSGSIDTPPTPCEPQSLRAIIRNIAAAHRLPMDEPQTRFHFRGNPALVLRRASEIEHILDTLIDNAVKYGPPTAPIEIAAYKHGPNVEILVSDHGKGIAPDDASSLFQSRGRELRPGSGHGLGLYLASEQASAVGGRLSCINAWPHGTTFRLIVPA